MRFCEEGGCPNIAVTGMFCATHQNSTTRKVKQLHPNDKWYARAAWKGPYGVRRYKLLRNPICEFVSEKSEPCARRAEDVHHIDGTWKEKGDWQLFLGGVNMENLMSLCKCHHSEITMNQIKEGTSCPKTA
jgi:hypothetical protein